MSCDPVAASALPMRLFRWSELEDLPRRRACTLFAASASELNGCIETGLWPAPEPEPGEKRT